MAAVPRKPGPLTPSNTRGVLCSSCPGKMYASVLRAAAVPWLPLSGMSQTGAVRGGGTEFDIMTRTLCNKVGTVLATECRLLLARESKKSKILWGSDCRVTLQFEAAFFDRRVLTADVDAELGLLTCVWSRIGQMARGPTPERSRAHENRTGEEAENSGAPKSDRSVACDLAP